MKPRNLCLLQYVFYAYKDRREIHSVLWEWTEAEVFFWHGLTASILICGDFSVEPWAM